ncbi:MAG TPA: hypothetical protein VFX03_07880 [Thermomicrobiales bacterium]|nr:hypothetical protein [Thermomicrobiales bacterium]
MTMTRRMVVAGAAAAPLAGLPLLATRAQMATPSGAATPTAGAAGMPGFAIGRVRKLPSAALNQAIYPDVMTRFLPGTAAIPGFQGYVFAFDEIDPATSLTMTFLASEVAADAADAYARAYVSQMDPRFVVATTMAERGPLRIFATTDAPAAALPPFLNGCIITMRNRTNAPGADMDALVAKAQATLVPTMRAMPGFVMYCWILTAHGRLTVNIWETDDQLQAGDKAVADWVAANSAATVTNTAVTTGRIGYAILPGIG